MDDFRQLGPKDAAPSVYKHASVLSHRLSSYTSKLPIRDLIAGSATLDIWV